MIKRSITDFKTNQGLCQQFISRWQKPDASVTAVAGWAGLSNDQASSLAWWLRVRLAVAKPRIIIIKKNKPPTLDFDALAREAGK